MSTGKVILIVVLVSIAMGLIGVWLNKSAIARTKTSKPEIFTTEDGVEYITTVDESGYEQSTNPYATPNMK
jgi:hypothetical protein